VVSRTAKKQADAKQRPNEPRAKRRNTLPAGHATMLIAQLTDIHLGQSGGADEPNTRRLEAALAMIFAGGTRPDALLVTGDLTEGEPASYRQLRSILADLLIPSHLCLGNHDNRAAFLAAFPETPTADGFVQYAVDDGPVRLLVLDTLEEGRDGGGFCAVRAAWLARRLAESARPTLLALHHPPTATGLDWIDVGAQEPWIDRLAAAVSGHDHVVGAVCGHLHRPIAARWCGLPVAVCAATAPQLALDLAPFDPQVPDGRALVVDASPAFALHRITPEGLVTHFTTVEPAPVILRHDERTQPTMRALADERRDS
jgi:3',5'-cyclic AMP phosphodiesterase CpdA